jgi:hypothetical protein
VNFISDLKYLFLVGGFAESAIVQNEIRQEFGNIIQVIIPQGVAMTILKGMIFCQEPNNRFFCIVQYFFIYFILYNG